MKNMHRSFVLRWLFLCAAAFLVGGGVSLFAQGQIDPDQNINAASLTEQEYNRPGGGVVVDARGLMLRRTAMDFGVLSRTQLNAEKAAYRLRGDVTESSPMRCISLNRLEKAFANAIEGDGMLTSEMLYLAGLQRITHVFYFPDSKDIVIAGPAEAWFPGYEDIMIGVNSLQPVLELRHLVTALRAYTPGSNGGNIVGCSIDPTEEGIAKLQQFQQQFGAIPRGLQQARLQQEFVQGVRENIGMQTVRVDGIPATTHAAQMMVAADYRMKRIALGEDRLAVRGLQSFIDNTESNTTNALFRWYFVPDYDAVILTEDRTGMQLDGKGIKLVGENELVAFEGGRVTVSGADLDRGSRAFTQSFTRLYPEISKQAMVFAQLRNWIDMLICAAHIQREDFYDQSGWSMEFFGDEERYRLETFPAPKEVEPIVAARTAGNRLLTPTGGVVIDAELALEEDRVRADTNNKIADQQKKITLDLPEGVWWWDVR